ncbi:MAG: hypothetical protein QOH09_3048 [Pseudonocardiales bacterium]|nr:hypothetical protein [Pseudonocardiales bacterium]
MSVKIDATALGSIILIAVLIAALVQATFMAVLGGGPTQPTQAALADIPPGYLALYRQAAAVCAGLDCSVLASIGKIETNHGRFDALGVHSGENSSGAGGPMQFLQPTFDGVIARHRLPPGASTPPSRYDPHAAIYAAAYYLCDSGAHDGHDLYQSIFAYNHADWYGRKVLDQAKIYAEATTVGTGDCNNIRSATRIDFAAINYACGQRGLPYVWGGNGTVDGGFDCSGLTTAAYAAAAITLPRTADSQYRAAAPDRPSIENNPEPTDLPLRPEQHAPPGVDVKDLRPLRGRPSGPIPDPDASTRRAQRQAERSQKRSQKRTRS